MIKTHTHKAHFSLMTSCTKTQQSVTLIDCPVIFAQWALRAICTCPPLIQLHVCEAPSEKDTVQVQSGAQSAGSTQQVVTTKQSILRSPWSIWLHSAQWPVASMFCCVLSSVEYSCRSINVFSRRHWRHCQAGVSSSLHTHTLNIAKLSPKKDCPPPSSPSVCLHNGVRHTYLEKI